MNEFENNQVEYLRQNIENPYTLIDRVFHSGKRLITIGNHHPSLPQQDFYLKVLDRVRGVDFLAVEIDVKYRQEVEDWLKTGQIKEGTRREIEKAGKKILEIVKKASEQEKEILYVDNKATERDVFMTTSIKRYMDYYPDQIGLFFVGNLHASIWRSRSSAEAAYYLSQYLKDEFYTIRQVDYGDEWGGEKPLIQAAKSLGLTDSVALANLSQTPFANVLVDRHDPIGELYDAVIIHPYGKRYE